MFQTGGVQRNHTPNHAIIFFEGENKNAKNKNQPGCRQTFQKNRFGEICVFQIPWQSHPDQKDDQTETITQKSPAGKEIGSKTGAVVIAEQLRQAEMFDPNPSMPGHPA